MNAYVLDPALIGMFVASLLDFALIAFVLGKAPSSPIRNSFILATATSGTYLFCGAVAISLETGVQNDVLIGDFSPAKALFFGEYFWSHLCWFAIFMLPCAFLYFYYVLANKKNDTTFRMIVGISTVVAASSIFSDKMILGGEWNVPLMGFIFVPSCFYGVAICAQTWWRSETKVDAKRNGLILLAVCVPMLLYSFVDLVLDKVFDVLEFDVNYVSALIGLIPPLVMGVAIIRYGFLRIDLSYVAEGLFVNAEDPVLLIRPDKKIARANPIAQEMFNVPEFSQSSANTNIQNIIPQYDESRHKFIATIAIDRVPRVFACSNSSVQTGKEKRGQILLLRDITKERELNSMKTEFTSTVSHELRTPLTSILGFARIIEKRLEEVILPNILFDTKKEQRSLKQVRRNLSVIVNEGQRLTQLINDVLDISKMEAGKLEWKFQRIKVDGILQSVLAKNQSLIEQKNLILRTRIAENVPEIIADPYRVEQVFGNILNNAIKFTSNGRIHVTLECRGKKVLVSFKDTGIGIEEYDLEKIFQKYQQVGDVLTDKPTGTGLGLPISKEIIDRHGGKISVQSIVGIGSLFEISLPLPVSARTTTDLVPLSTIFHQWQNVEEKTIPTENPNLILLIEDEMYIREMLRQALEPAGFSVIEAKDGLEGLEVVRSQNPGLVIVDVMMPKLNGFEVVTILKNDPKTINIPIVMLTVVDDVQRGYGLGVDLYLKKPIEPEQIVKEVKKVLKQKGDVQTTVLLGNPGYGKQYLKQMLSNSGQNILTAPNVEGLKELLATTQPDMILVEAEAFTYDEVYIALNEVSLDSKLLVKFISND